MSVWDYESVCQFLKLTQCEWAMVIEWEKVITKEKAMLTEWAIPKHFWWEMGSKWVCEWALANVWV